MIRASTTSGTPLALSVVYSTAALSRLGIALLSHSMNPWVTDSTAAVSWAGTSLHSWADMISI